ncbi:hypothetical protein cypCar_00031214, partial [Cyprinus carpio]
MFQAHFLKIWLSHVATLHFMSKNGSIKPKEKLNNYQPKVIALTGPYGSTRTMTIAPLITMALIPMVNYGASTYALSNKLQYPSFLLGEIKKLDFILNGRQVKYDDHFDPAISFAVVLWHTEVNPPKFEMVGTYDKHPEITFTIDNALLPWHKNGSETLIPVFLVQRVNGLMRAAQH